MTRDSIGLWNWLVSFKMQFSFLWKLRHIRYLYQKHRYASSCVYSLISFNSPNWKQLSCFIDLDEFFDVIVTCVCCLVWLAYTSRPRITRFDLPTRWCGMLLLNWKVSMATSSNIVEFVGEGALEANRGKGTSKQFFWRFMLSHSLMTVFTAALWA